jgi:hypothetical protein
VSDDRSRGSGDIARARHEILAIVSLLALSSLAFVRLRALPPFEDEGTQVRWITRFIEVREWLQPLDEGRPLQVWPLALPVRLFGHPWVVMRVVNALAGMAGTVLTHRVATRFGDRWTAWACGVLFAVCPFVVYLQRVALADMYLCVAALSSLLSLLRFLESPSSARAAVLGLCLVLAALSKLPVGFEVATLVPLALVLLPAADRRTLLSRPALVRGLLAHAPVAALAAVVTIVGRARVREGTSPRFGLQTLAGVAFGDQDIAHGYGVPGMSLLGELSAQLSWPVVALAGIGVALAASRGARARWLLCTGLLPMLVIACLARFWFSRYLLFTLPPLIIGAAIGWRALGERLAAALPARWLRLDVAAFAGCVVLMGRQSFVLIRDPVAASWSPVDHTQYIEGGGSGYGYPEAASFILASPEAPAAIYALDGHSAYQLQSSIQRIVPSGCTRRRTLGGVLPPSRRTRRSWSRASSTSSGCAQM